MHAVAAGAIECEACPFKPNSAPTGASHSSRRCAQIFSRNSAEPTSPACPIDRGHVSSREGHRITALTVSQTRGGNRSLFHRQTWHIYVLRRHYTVYAYSSGGSTGAVPRHTGTLDGLIMLPCGRCNTQSPNPHHIDRLISSRHHVL